MFLRANPEDMALHGNWGRTERSDTHYMDGMNKRGGTAAAGHWAGSFFLPRSGITPPQVLLDLVFPFVDVWLQHWQQHNASQSSVKKQEVATVAFLRLMKYGK